jgi:hypothetical protein
VPSSSTTHHLLVATPKQTATAASWLRCYSSDIEPTKEERDGDSDGSDDNDTPTTSDGDVASDLPVVDITEEPVDDVKGMLLVVVSRCGGGGGVGGAY